MSVIISSLGDYGDAAEDRLAAFQRALPRPGPRQGVRGDALAGAMKLLEPLAKRVLALKDGSKKPGKSGTGYSSGSSTVTPEDKAVAGRLLYEINTRLPKYGAKPVEAWLYSQVKENAYKLLLIGTDIDFDMPGVVDKVGWYFNSVGQSVVDLPETLKQAAKGAKEAAKEVAKGAGELAWSTIPTEVKVIGGLALGLLGYGLFQFFRHGTPVAMRVVERAANKAVDQQLTGVSRRRSRSRSRRRV